MFVKVWTIHAARNTVSIVQHLKIFSFHGETSQVSFDIPTSSVSSLCEGWVAAAVVVTHFRVVNSKGNGFMLGALFVTYVFNVIVVLVNTTLMHFITFALLHGNDGRRGKAANASVHNTVSIIENLSLF